MKRIITTLISVAFTMMAFVSCQKDISIAQEESTIVFHSTRPQLDVESKTMWNGKKIQWAGKDAIRMAYMVDGNWQNATGNVSDGGKAKFYASKSTTLSDDSMTAEFEISDSFTGESEGQHKFFALYPSSAYDGSGTDVNPTQVPVVLPSEQTCSWIDDTSVLSFDSSADLMYGVSVGEYNTRPTSVDMSWQRIVAHAFITLNDLKDVTDGEIVSSVSLTANDGAALSGTYKMNLEDGSLTPSEITNKIVVDGKNLQISEGDVVFWACMMPCTWKSLTVVVDTDKATYIREIDLTGKEKTFLQNRRNLLAINMSEAAREEKAVSTAYYEKVTSAPTTEDWSGTYLMVCDSKKMVLSGISTTNTKYGIGTEVDIKDNRIEATEKLVSYQVVLSPGTTPSSYLMEFNGSYLYWSSGNSLATDKADNDNTNWVISISNGNVTIKNCKDQSRVIGWNASNPRFACYTSNQTAIQLYKLEEGNAGDGGGETPELTVTPEIIEVPADGDIVEFGYTVTNPVEGVYASAVTEVTWLSDFVYTATNTVKFTVAKNPSTEARETVITLSYEGAESKTVTVKQAGAGATEPETPDTEGTHYVKVTSAPTDWSGDYLIVYEQGNLAFNGGLTDLDVVSNTVTVDIADGKIKATDGMKASQFTIDANGYIKSASGYYIGQTSDANGLKSDKINAFKNTLSLNGGTVNIVSSNAYLRYNATSGQNRFRYYKSGTYSSQKAIALYKLQ